MIQISKYICDRCKENYKTEETVNTPVSTIVGTVAGLIAGLFTGYTAVLVPMGLFAGLAVDAARCEECGTDKNLYEVMLEKVNKSGEKVYQSVPLTLYEPSKHYRYNEVEGHFIETEADPESIELNILTNDFPDYEVSFDLDMPDALLEIGSFDFDMGDSGEGGDFGGTGPGEGDLGGGDMGSGFGGDSGGGE